jgi:hypothetical protein
MMRTLSNTVRAALCVLALSVPAARAQQQQTPDQQQQPPTQQQSPDQSAAPIPAYHSPLASAADNDDSDSEQTMPDNRPLSGAQDLSPLLLPTRSYWQPQINVFTFVDSNPGVTASTTDWTEGASLSGNLEVHRISGNSIMDLNYTAGGTFSGDGGAGNGVIQALGFKDTFTFHRSTFSLFDQLTYLPGSDFGFGGLGGLGGTTLPGSGSSGIGSVFAPGQTILTGEGQTLGNSVVSEFDYLLTPRSSLTFVGGYYVLHNYTSGLLNSTNPNFRAGYNYQVTHKDTMAVFYTFSEYSYSNSGQSTDTHTVQLSYGRLVSGKLSFQIAAGPQFIVSRFPLSATGSSGSAGGTGTVPASTTTQLNWALSAALTWTAERNTFGISYNHGANNGSGVLAGAVSDTVTASLRRAASRTFSSGISAGYSRNNGVAFVTGTTTSFYPTYDYWYASASLSHPVGRSLGLTLSYLVQYQQNPRTASPCAGPTCGTNSVVNLVSFGVGWHERPLAF